MAEPTPFWVNLGYTLCTLLWFLRSVGIVTSDQWDRTCRQWANILTAIELQKQTDEPSSSCEIYEAALDRAPNAQQSAADWRSLLLLALTSSYRRIWSPALVRFRKHKSTATWGTTRRLNKIRVGYRTTNGKGAYIKESIIAIHGGWDVHQRGCVCEMDCVHAMCITHV